VTARLARCLALATLLALTAAPAAARVLITGELRAADAEPIFVPFSNYSPVVLRYYVPEGTQVQPGDVLVRVDPGNSASMVRQLEAQIEQTQARAEQELATLQVQAIDAERALVDAEAAHDKAAVDAAIPRQYLSVLDADRYAGELETSRRELDLKRKEWSAAQEAVARRRHDAGLELAKLQADLDFHRAQVATAEQRAERAGVVIHGFDSSRGQRYDEGSSAYPGNRIGEVVGGGGVEVRAWALEPDRARLRAGQSVRLYFDALPGVELGGRIERIAGAPEPRQEWGDGRYFTLDVSFDPGQHTERMRPGMSVRIEADGEGA